MPDLSFHSVTKVIAERHTRGKTDWFALTIFEEQIDGHQKTRITLFVEDAALADRLVAAINSAAQAPVEEAA